MIRSEKNVYTEIHSNNSHYIPSLLLVIKGVHILGCTVPVKNTWNNNSSSDRQQQTYRKLGGV